MVTEFEKTLLEKVDRMDGNLSLMNDRLTEFEVETKKTLTELNGKIKGNQELITKDLNSYVSKSTCEMHREKQGYRISEIERDMAVVKNRINAIEGTSGKKDSVTAERITAWLPTIILSLIITGGFIWMQIK